MRSFLHLALMLPLLLSLEHSDESPDQDEPKELSAAVDELLQPQALPGFVIADRNVQSPSESFGLEVGTVTSDYLERTFRSIASVRYVNPDDAQVLVIVLVDHATTEGPGASIKEEYIPTLFGGAELWVSPQEHQDSEQHGSRVEVQGTKGRTVVSVNLVDADSDYESTSQVAIEIAAAQIAVVSVRPSVPIRSIEIEDLRARSVRSLLSYMITLPVLSILLSLLRDPSMWTRIYRVQHLNGTKEALGGVDLTSASRKLRRKDLIGSLPVSIATILVIYIAIYSRTSKTVALVLGLTLLLLLELVRSAILRLLGRERFEHERVPMVANVFALAVSTLIVALAVRIIDAASIVALTGIPLNPQSVADGIANAMLVLAALVLLVAPVPLRIVRARFRKPLTREGAKILLLRSFADDRLRIRVGRRYSDSVLSRLAQGRSRRFEELVVRALSRYGTVTAIDEPGRRLSLLGAHRVTVSGADWLEQVVDLARSSDHVVIIVGRSEGVLLEIGALRSAGLLERCLFMFPNVGDEEIEFRSEVVRSMLCARPGGIGVPKGRSLIAAKFDSNGDLRRYLYSLSKDYASYDVAIDSELERRHGAEFAPHDAPRTWNRVVPEGDAHSLVFAPGEAPRPGRPWFLRVSVVVFLLINIANSFLNALEPFDQVVVVESQLRVTDLSLTTTSYDDNNWTLLSNVSGSSISTLPHAEAGQVFHVVAGNRSATSDSFVVIFDRSAGKMRRYDLPLMRGASPVWEADVSHWTESIIVDSGKIYSSLPGRDSITIRSSSDGSLVDAVSLAGAPWDIALSGEQLLVTLANDKVVVVLDRALNEVGRFDVLEGPRELVVDSQLVFVNSVVDDGVAVIDVLTEEVQTSRLEDVDLTGQMAAIDDRLFLSHSGILGNMAIYSLEAQEVFMGQLGSGRISELRSARGELGVVSSGGEFFLVEPSDIRAPSDS